MRGESFRLELDAGTRPLEGPFRTLSDETAGGVRRLTVALDDGARLADLLRAVLATGAGVRACDRIEPDLEQAFSRILADEGSAT